ncbi:MAG: energy-coupling factor transporter transmembrane protein EcfT [candidate division Zixibacteria bacterium]|nr:energy-coupling factor transporter transmembrane protein EcfT [candidate division Zixibacteria bacterium]
MTNIKSGYNAMLAIDPRVKLVWFLSCTSVYFTNNPFLILLITSSGVLGFVLSKSHRTIYMKGVIYISVFFVFIFVLALWESTEIDNLLKAFLIICKWAAVISSSIALFVSTRPFDLVDSLRSFRVPKGFTFALGIGFRFVPIIFEESSKILLAQKARGLNAGRGVREITKIPLVLYSVSMPLLSGMMTRLEDMWLALKIRGFELKKQRRKIQFGWSVPNIGLSVYSIAIITLSVLY